MNFRLQLQKQLKFIDTSCRLYDEGEEDEAVRIATSIRILFHDTSNSTSLLTHLEKKDSVNLLSTAFETDAFMNITNIEINLEALSGNFVPKLDSASIRNFIPFKHWWNIDIIYNKGNGKFTVKRKDLVLNAANRDGGAHVDKSLDPFYEDLSNGAGCGMELTIDGKKIKYNSLNAHLAALRQIGYEVLHSPDIGNI